VPHWFDGDGAVTAVRLAGGHAWGASRLVRTSGLEREEKAGRRLFGGYGTPLVRPVRELLLGDMKNPANTSVLLWQGRLFATCEADKPYEVDPRDLSTFGETSLSGALVGPFSAHAHRVPQRRAIYNFGLGHGRNTQVDAYELPDDGAARRIATFHLDGVRILHDFAATERHLVFAFSPLYLSLLNTVVLRKAPVASAVWKASRGTEIVVVPIDTPSLVRRFQVDAFLFEHLVNAFDDGDRIVVDYTHYAHPDGLERFVGGLTSGRIDAPLRSEIRRMTLRAGRDGIESEPVLRRAVELPRVSPRVEGRRHRFTYYAGFADDGGPFQRVLKHDLETDRVDAYEPGRLRYAGEPVFVPRSGASDEDDGWILTMAYDARSDRSALEVLDARRIADGPVASCHFDHAIPFGFHGAWAPAS
jgi:all-trans-8'-apo-beta-carotenal 15,15'-oxygenase